MPRNLEEYNGAYKGRTCFIVAPGPSVYEQDLAPLEDHVTIAVNGGICAYPKSDFFVSDDWDVANWTYFSRDLRNLDTNVLLYDAKLSNAVSWFGDRSILFRHRKGHHVTDEYIHDDPAKHIWEARTTAGTAIHIAHIMGCSEIVLIGMDCCRTKNKRYFWEFPMKQEHTCLKTVPRRTDKRPADRYRKTKQGATTTDTDLMQILAYWKKVGEVMNSHCRILNASPNSIIDVFPKINLSEYIGTVQVEESG